jgi:lipoic acid synthetase
MSDLTEGQTGTAKTARNPVKVIPITPLKKPDWIRVKAGNSQAFYEVKRRLREHNLHTVCEEASCPNIGECFGKGTATSMILGELCTRRCPFCDVAHGRPEAARRRRAAQSRTHRRAMGLKYVVITSVDRDDCATAERGTSRTASARCAVTPTRIEILTPDFRGRGKSAGHARAGLPDVMNHNLETVPRLYRVARPGADYRHSLRCCRTSSSAMPASHQVGLMVGLGETTRKSWK